MCTHYKKENIFCSSKYCNITISFLFCLKYMSVSQFWMSYVLHKHRFLVVNYHVAIFKAIKFYNNAKKFQVFAKTLVNTPGTILRRNFKLSKTKVLFRYNPKLMRRDLLGKRHQVYTRVYTRTHFRQITECNK